jgi:hypothetical protein
MLTWHRTTIFVMVASSLVQSQLVIENPKHLEISEPQAQALYLTTTRVMEEEFHSPGTLENRFRMRLVLGQKPERFTIDDPSGNGSIYLEKWNGGKFAVAAMRLAIQHLLVPERQKRMLEEIGRRTREIAPVSADRLRKEGAPAGPLSSDRDDCFTTMMNAGAHAVNCKPTVVAPRR